MTLDSDLDRGNGNPKTMARFDRLEAKDAKGAGRWVTVRGHHVFIPEGHTGDIMSLVPRQGGPAITVNGSSRLVKHSGLVLQRNWTDGPDKGWKTLSKIESKKQLAAAFDIDRRSEYSNHRIFDTKTNQDLTFAEQDSLRAQIGLK